MKRLLIIIILISAQFLHAQSPAPKGKVGVDCWEILTDIYIGVQTESLTDEERQSYGTSLPSYRGLRIKRVHPDSPAEKGGLRAGDIITLMSGGSIRSMKDMFLSVRYMRPGDIVHFGILRDGVEKVYPVRVGGLPEPVVVAYAYMKDRSTPQLIDMQDNENRVSGHLGKEAPCSAAMAACQSAIAGLLSKENPDLDALRKKFKDVNNLFYFYDRPGQVRLYYETEGGYLTVTCYPAGIIVTAPKGPEVEVYHLRQQGDSLPETLRQVFANL